MLTPLDGLSTDRGLKQLYEDLNVLFSHFSADYVYDGNRSVAELIEELKNRQYEIPEEPDISSVKISDASLILELDDGSTIKNTLKRNNENKITSIISEDGLKINISYN